MFRLIASASLLAIALARPASAQEGGASQDVNSVGVVPPRGMSFENAQAMMMIMRGASNQVRDNCWSLGCVLIVNDTSGYDVVGFYLDAAKPGQNPRWSHNQFAEPLWPSKATLRFKTGSADTCSMPVRFVLRHRETREKTEISGTSSFCTTPHQDTLIRIKMLEGKVYVRGDDEPDPDAKH